MMAGRRSTPADLMPLVAGRTQNGTSRTNYQAPGRQALLPSGSRRVKMSFPDKALWIIERNSTQPLTLDGIAAACGVSRSHLAHAFGTATGLSVMQYVRARRLSAAAQALAGGAPDILS